MRRMARDERGGESENGGRRGWSESAWRSAGAWLTAETEAGREMLFETGPRSTSRAAWACAQPFVPESRLERW